MILLCTRKYCSQILFYFFGRIWRRSLQQLREKLWWCANSLFNEIWWLTTLSRISFFCFHSLAWNRFVWNYRSCSGSFFVLPNFLSTSERWFLRCYITGWRGQKMLSASSEVDSFIRQKGECLHKLEVSQIHIFPKMVMIVGKLSIALVLRHQTKKYY